MPKVGSSDGGAREGERQLARRVHRAEQHLGHRLPAELARDTRRGRPPARGRSTGPSRSRCRRRARPRPSTSSPARPRSDAPGPRAASRSLPARSSDSPSRRGPSPIASTTTSAPAASASTSSWSRQSSSVSTLDAVGQHGTQPVDQRHRAQRLHLARAAAAERGGRRPGPDARRCVWLAVGSSGRKPSRFSSRTIDSRAASSASSRCSCGAHAGRVELERTAEHPGGELHREDAPCRLVDQRRGECALPRRRSTSARPVVERLRHLDVEAGADRGVGRLGGVPIGDDDRREAPLLAQHLAQQPLVLGAVDAVEAVRRGHDRERAVPRAPPLRTAVGRARAASRSSTRVSMSGAIGLVVMADEVLGCRDRALRLGAAHEGDAEPRREERDPRRRPRRRGRRSGRARRRARAPAASCGPWPAPRRAIAPPTRSARLGVPRRGDRDRHRKRGGAIGVAVEVAPHRLADAVRSVGGLEGGNVEPAIDGAAHLAGAVELRDLLLEGHRGEEGLGVAWMALASARADSGARGDRGPRRYADAIPQEGHHVVMNHQRQQQDAEEAASPRESRRVRDAGLRDRGIGRATGRGESSWMGRGRRAASIATASFRGGGASLLGSRRRVEPRELLLPRVLGAPSRVSARRALRSLGRIRSAHRAREPRGDRRGRRLLVRRARAQRSHRAAAAAARQGRSRDACPGARPPRAHRSCLPTIRPFSSARSPTRTWRCSTSTTWSTAIC